MHRAFAIAVLLAAGTAPATAAAVDHGVRLVKTTIPLSDGVRLAATLYMPADLRPGERAPALLEYLPYRKDDDTTLTDYANHAYFARHGFVGVRVDIRGFGASGGAPTSREYSEQEQKDGDEVIAYLARQPWSNGAVGMLGISWGAFNSIQMAMRGPPALKAILAVAGTEALYTEDVHYIDGIFHVDEFEVAMDLDQGRSPAPDFPLDEATLAARMDSPPWSLDYFRHQRDGAFWRAPLRRLEDIHTPCFLIGGLQDGYRDSLPRMLERVPAPVHAWLGPWNHDYPNTSIYGPRLEWRAQAVRWFDHWLKGIDNGVERDPRLVVFEQQAHPPGAGPQDVPGEWRAESWPPANLKTLTLSLAADHRLISSSTGASATTSASGATSGGGAEGHDRLRNVPSAGTEAGFWWGELLEDQRPADAYALIYESATLDTQIALLGAARATLTVTANAPLADWIVRLEDVAPDGAVTAITGGAINGAQRASREHPEALVPGREYTLEIPMRLSTWVWPKGHRIRLAVSNALWPMLWPTPYPLETTLRLGGPAGSVLMVPTVPVEGAKAPPLPTALEPIEAPPGISTPGDYAWPGSWKLERDEAHAVSKVTWRGTSAMQFPWGSFEHSEQILYTLEDAHPERAAAVGDGESIERLKDRVLTYRGHLSLTSDASMFHYAFTRTLERDGHVVRTRTWREDIPRDLQ
jgi:predicted acyl esterase